MQVAEPENLFTVIQRGDRRIRKAHKKAIILVGLTRIGKSTTFNWILRKPMKGKGNLMSYYINSVDNDETAAKVGNSYSSVTLAPNVHINYEEGISLIDMAGYEDNRNYVGVIGVSYFLKTLFEQVRQAKFVIVFDEYKFSQQNGSGLIRTFNGFINMFQYNEMPKEIKDKLKSSISVVITKSRKQQFHFEYFDEVIYQLKNQDLIVQNRETVIELMEYIRNSARIQAFLAARDSSNPQDCDFINNFSLNKGWNYFDLDYASKVMEQSPISLPFTRDFNKLNEAERKAFTATIENRVNSYVGFSQILRVVITNFSDNWSEFIDTWKNQRKAVPNYFMMKHTFDKIREFVQANDVYNSKESIQIKFRVNYDPMTLVKSIKQILSIYEHINRIGAPQGTQTFSEAMSLFHLQFSALVQSLKGFASNNQQQELLQRLKYVLIRGFREFSKLYQLDKDCINDAKQKLRDNCNLVFEIDKFVFTQKFVAEFSQDLLVKLFPTIEMLQEYRYFFNEYQQKYKQQDSTLFFSQQRFSIEMAKADILVAIGQRAKALLCYINGLKNISQISQCVSTSKSQDKEDFLNKLSMKKLKLIRKIVNILKALPESQNYNYKRYALWLCQRHRMIQDSFLIYEQMINSTFVSILQKLKIYNDFANECAKWGQVQRGIQLLQKKLMLQEQNFEYYCNTWIAIKTMASKKDQYMKELIILIDIKRLPEVDNELNQILQEIECLLQI